MELKDVIISTLAEMEEPIQEKTVQKIEEINELKIQNIESDYKEEAEIESKSSLDSELLYLSSIKERLLVLFEGFQAPNNTNLEAKIDMTLNFLEYTLATIETRIEHIEKG